MIKATIEISEDDLKEYCSQFLNDEEIENMNLNSEVVDILEGILQSHFSNFQVYNNSCIILNGEN